MIVPNVKRFCRLSFGAAGQRRAGELLKLDSRGKGEQRKGDRGSER